MTLCPSCRRRSVPPSTTSPRTYCETCAAARKAAQKDSTRTTTACKLRLSPEARAALEDLAERDGASMSAIVEGLILATKR